MRHSQLIIAICTAIAVLSTFTNASDDDPVTSRFKCRANGCCDHHEWCRFWASVGECKTNEEWMEDNCQLACGTCRKALAKASTANAHPFTKTTSAPTTPRRPTTSPTTTPETTEAPTTTRQQRPAPTSAPLSSFQRTPSTFSTVRPNVVQFRTRVTRPPPTTRRTFPTTRPTITTTTTTTTTTPPPPPPPLSPVDRCREIMRNPETAAENLLREGLVFPVEDASGRRPLDLDTIIRSNLANACVPRNDEAECDRSLCYNLYFRTFDGTCNNLENPLQGSAFRPYNRLIKPQYDNEVSEPISQLNPHLRPNPREITKRLISSSEVVLSNEFNALLMQFGQFTSHDMAKTTLVPSSKCNVCQNITSRCMAVEVPKFDDNRDFQSNKCIRVSRSSPICGSGNRLPRQQLNENSGYIDASPIYGSSVHDSKKFRNGNTGFLRLNQFNGMQTLPFDMTKCKNKNDCNAIFTAGDSRVNLFVGLGTFHILLTKEHNRIASQLQRLNPHWNGDRLFMETRKIIGAQVQAIVFREYLPKILGAAFATHIGEYRGYDPNEDATLVNEFTSAAFRFGHGMIQESYARLDERFGNTTFGPMDFVHGTLHSDVLIFEGGIDPMIRGLMTQRVKRPQRVTRTVTEKMFGSTDLSTINIQRGRDHGHAPYVRFRELCGMGTATNFEHLSREILSTGVRRRLQEVYGSVDRIDLWVGALMEDPVVRAMVGPTVACIIGPQFKRTRDGDRFYYENPGVFTRAQLAEIRRSSLSRIICDNSVNINMVPREAFRVGRMVPCTQIPRMDLTKWRE
ncbi:hypothetical protein PFISCL1PPCAC_5583 [Pristionchus fissidentatus]|uniref:peroxidase n=1 Tax=Pristionchus fissidentatus TaxID=1538716 RepID=A0AAV5V6B9_9BILA|nr:hypothetical protein PFISCL1PPCAC_5583 [Pristionchus fissidentatus]